ncbi:MAG TPA: hypothetical protein VFP37_05615 [Steroidobacteraceae bacterium]|nr:hypothetical protein [Steroidobacteraceae bacterium]
MLVRRLTFASIFFVALSLVPAGAHLMSLPNKIHMSAADYLVAQQAYRGWAFAGILIFSALIATGWLGLALRRERRAIGVFVAFACLVLAQVSFWMLTFPGNAATMNWTTLPANWEELRFHWELGHAIGALLTLAALTLLLTEMGTFSDS